MKKLFLLPLMAFVMLFTSCEKVELFDGFVEPCHEFGASSAVVKKYMSKLDVTLLDEDLDENYLSLEYGNYGVINYFYYEFEDDKLYDAYIEVDVAAYPNVVAQLEEKYPAKSVLSEADGGEYRYYANSDKSIIVSIFVPNDYAAYEWDSFYVSYYTPETLGEAFDALVW